MLESGNRRISRQGRAGVLVVDERIDLNSHQWRTPTRITFAKPNREDLHLADSKLKMEDHEAAVALHFLHFNFCWIHKTLCVTPSMEAGIAHTPWTIEQLIALMPEPEAKKRGP